MKKGTKRSVRTTVVRRTRSESGFIVSSNVENTNAI